MCPYSQSKNGGIDMKLSIYELTEIIKEMDLQTFCEIIELCSEYSCKEE
ncbi:hypothetical protein KOY_04516 [Bacillus cereus VDM021]|nr:hypothetical protein KOY_04516 [Bacillus cereus VDM021]